MLLTKIIVQHVGPFAASTEICFERDLTVLTGANDTGKSSILRVVELVCGMKGHDRILQEGDVNLDHASKTQTAWKKDVEIQCDVTFEGTTASIEHVGGEFGPGSEMALRCQLSPDARQIVGLKWRTSTDHGWSSGGSIDIRSFPKIVRLPMAEAISSIIDLDHPNLTEREFLRAAFGPGFSFDKISLLNDPSFYNAISKARGNANAMLKRCLPKSTALEFDFQSVQGDRKKLSIHLRDHNHEHTLLTLRGAGVQRLTSLMAGLLSGATDNHHCIILLDEPELSLHADVQHAFRAVLESLADQPTIQVIYATHSPSMINPMRPSALRVVRRENKAGIPTSVIDHRPIDDNFLSVRSSLGITPSDSLLYAPITVIVEGPTEVIGLPIILIRMWKSGHENFSDTGALLSHVHLLDGSGDSFEFFCRIAKSQSAKPVVFLDGDKTASRLQKLKKDHPDVPVVVLKPNTDFEQLVLPATYFESLAQVMSEFSDEAISKLTQVTFEAWKKEKSPPEKMAFSKKIDRWVQDTIDCSVEKPLVMKHALQKVELRDVVLDPLIDLVNAIRNQLTK